MKNCKLMINPSLSEGWGNSIDHSIHFKKYIILSKIPVHIEQNPLMEYFLRAKTLKISQQLF